MENFPINPADAVIAVVLLISAAFAFVRGFVREALGMAAWAGAAFAVVYAFEPAKPYVRGLIKKTLLADAVTLASIFLGTLIILTIVAHAVTARVRGSRLGGVDRSLGFAFGLLRGAVVMSLAYMFLVWAVAPEDRPAWIEEARFTPWVKGGAEMIRNLVPPEARAESAAIADDLKRRGEAAIGAEDGAERPGEAGTHPAATEEKGYEPDERKALDNLYETIP